MAYIGREPLSGEVVLINSIESQFNGVLTTFNLTRTVSGVTSAFYPISSEQLLVSLGGVIQEPDPTGDTGFRINFNQIIFALAPAAGVSCFIISYGNILDIGAPANNTVTTEKLANGSVTPIKLSTGGPWWLTNGNVGIGTTNPGQLLELYGSNKLIKVNSTTDNSSIAIGQWDIANNRIESVNRPLYITTYTGNINLGPSNSQVLSITQGSNVGIGITNPTEKLHIQSTGVVYTAVESTTAVNTGLRLKNAQSDWYIINDSAGDIQFYNGSRHLNITSTGNVGIGTANPTAKLEVSNSSGTTGILVSNNVAISFRDSTGAARRTALLSESNNFYYGDVDNATSSGNLFLLSKGNINFFNNGTNNVTFSSTGFVGIGTDNPAALLHSSINVSTSTVHENIRIGGTHTGAGGGGWKLTFNQTGDGNPEKAYLSTIYTTNAAWETQLVSTGYLTFHTNSNEKLRIDSSGNVGIGTTNPSERFHLHNPNTGLSVIRLSGSAVSQTPYDIRQGIVGVANSGFSIWDVTAAATRFAIDSAGNIGIGTDNPTFKLDVNGGFAAGTTGAQRLHITSYSLTNGELPNPSVVMTTPGNYPVTIFGNGTTGGTGGGVVLSYYTSSSWRNALEIYNTSASVGNLVLMKSGGNVGIGTTNPTSALHVIGSIQSSDGVRTLEQVRAIGWYNTPTGSSYSGLAVEMGMSSGTGYILCYNRDNGNWGTLNIQGSSGATLISFPSTGNTINVTGNISSNGNIAATNFSDVTGSYNVNLGSGGLEGRALVAGYSGGSYGGIGYNVRHTTTGGTYIAPIADTSNYLLFNQGFTFFGETGGAAGRTLSYSSLARIDNSGNLSQPVGGSHHRIAYSSGSNNYSSTLWWNGLALGNNGTNFIVAGRTDAGGSLAFYVNNTIDISTNTTPGGTLALTLASTAAATFSSSVTVGGPIFRSVAGTSGYLNGNYPSIETETTPGTIYTIGGAYVPTATTLGSMYGIGYGYSGGGGAIGNPGGVPSGIWGMYVASAGTARIFLDSDVGRGYFASDVVAGGGVIANGAVYAAGTSGFYSSTYAANARNPIWRFGNADPYGLSYFQGSAGVSPAGGGDTIGFHFGTATAAASLLQLNNGHGAVVNGNFAATGNVGIGTTNPGVQLDCIGSGRFYSSSGNTNLSIGRLGDSIYYNSLSIYTGYASTAESYSIGFDYLGTTTRYQGELRFNQFAGGTDFTERMRISSTGNVGIGTTNPEMALHIFTPSDTVPVRIASNGGDSSIGFKAAADALTYNTRCGSYQGAGFGIWTANTIRSVVDNIGNVGIGTTNPTAKLVVDGGGLSSIAFRDDSIENHKLDSDSGAISFNYYGLNGGASRFRDVSIYNGKGGLISIFDGSSGNVGIGVANPTQKLEVNGNILVGSSAYNNGLSPQIRLGHRSENLADGTQRATIQFDSIDPVSVNIEDAWKWKIATVARVGNADNYNSNLEILRTTRNGVTDNTDFCITRTGNVGIGITNPNYKLEVNGSFGATTKSFIIDHPTKPGKRLQYGSLEGPENGVYIRGRSSELTIELPEYWIGLVHEDSITVNLTPIGDSATPRVRKIENNQVEVFSREEGELDYYYMILGERKDVDRLEVELEG
jgi:hypothetical protein